MFGCWFVSYTVLRWTEAAALSAIQYCGGALRLLVGQAGLEHFYIYDRYDAFGAILRPFVQRGVVTRLLFAPLSEPMLMTNENTTIAYKSTFYDQVGESQCAGLL